VISVIIPSRTLEEGEVAVRRLPPGADEVILIFGNPVHPGHIRNLGAREARGSILLFADDDARIQGDLSWFKREPPYNRWWTASGYTDGTDDPSTRAMAAWWTFAGNLGIWSGTVGAFIACRRELFDRVGGFPLRYVGEDAGIGEAFWRAGARMVPAPVTVKLLRPSPFVTKALARNHEFMAMPRPERLPFVRYAVTPP
jgi:hypothetical protein